jgi:glycosyltransferase involved in cell wall biosynthesis
MISVVMQSYLGLYKNAAKDRDKKIVRAIQSILNQTIIVEPVIVSDGCDLTVKIINSHFAGKVSGYMIAKQTTWSGVPRNTGIRKAKGDIICYLDVDDFLEPDHCEKIERNFSGDWVWFDDIVFSKHDSKWKRRNCDVNKKGLCGTSNVAHRKIAEWPVKGSYAHDWVFINNLKAASKNFKYIGHGGYKVSHIPGRYDI